MGQQDKMGTSKMKRIMMLVAFVGMLCYGHCQDVKVNINNQEATTKEDCAYRINGICSTEDIGGVDVEFDAVRNDAIYAVFTNYNSFTVTVLYEVGHNHIPYSGIVEEDGTTKTGSIVLKSGGSKRVKIFASYSIYEEFAQYYFVKGLITRKIQ